MRIKKDNIYKEYLTYLNQHKRNYWTATKNELQKNISIGKKILLVLEAITHDLSKYSPLEFIPYAKWFYGLNGMYVKTCLCQDNYDGYIGQDIKKRVDYNEQRFEKAWKLHYKRNKHHWDFWHELHSPIPNRFIDQMILDWSAMSIQFGDTPQEFYLNNYHEIILDRKSRLSLEQKLGLSKMVKIPFQEYECCDTLYEIACKYDCGTKGFLNTIFYSIDTEYHINTVLSLQKKPK